MTIEPSNSGRKEGITSYNIFLRIRRNYNQTPMQRVAAFQAYLRTGPSSTFQNQGGHQSKSCCFVHRLHCLVLHAYLKGQIAPAQNLVLRSENISCLAFQRRSVPSCLPRGWGGWGVHQGPRNHALMDLESHVSSGAMVRAAVKQCRIDSLRKYW